MSQAALIPGFLAALAGAMALYLASRHQKLLAGPVPRRTLAVAGAALLAGSLVLFQFAAGPASTVFIWMISAMLVWAAAPLAIAYWRRGREGGQ